MSEPTNTAIRVLVADDEPSVLEAYRNVFSRDSAASADSANAMQDLRTRLFGVGSPRREPPGKNFEIVTAYSDVDPVELAARVPPAEKLFYVQKPFHSHEVRQLALELRRKAQGEVRIRQLAYYDTLTGLPNRELFRAYLSQGIDLQHRDRSVPPGWRGRGDLGQERRCGHVFRQARWR